MSQTYQRIGGLAPAAERILGKQQGWDGLAGDAPVAGEPIDQLTDPATFSRWNLRTNGQCLAVMDDTSMAADFFDPGRGNGDIAPLAGYGRGGGSYDQTPAAALVASPPPAVTFDDESR
ncbi:MAG: hypothetical protein ACRDFX_03435 [Chloroflexota bacterium]